MSNPEQIEIIKNKMESIFLNRFHCDLSKCNPDDFDKSLLANPFYFKPRNLLYLLFDIEKEFSILIPEIDIASGKFNTFNNIACIIENQLSVGTDTKG